MSLFGNTKELKNTIQSLESEVSTLKKELEDLRKYNESYVNIFRCYNERDNHDGLIFLLNVGDKLRAA